MVISWNFEYVFECCGKILIYHEVCLINFSTFFVVRYIQTNQCARTRSANKFWLDEVMRSAHLEDLCTNRKIVLKAILRVFNYFHLRRLCSIMWANNWSCMDNCCNCFNFYCKQWWICIEVWKEAVISYFRIDNNSAEIWSGCYIIPY